MAERMPLAGDGVNSALTRSWLAAEEASARKNARIIDKVMVALPRELTTDQQVALVRAFAEEVCQGRAPWLAAVRYDDADNPHAHLVIRDKDPITGKRVAKLSEIGSTARLRLAWEGAANSALERAGRHERIDRRRLKEQGLARSPAVRAGPKARHRPALVQNQTQPSANPSGLNLEQTSQ